MRGLVHVRSILSSIGAFVLPDQVAIGTAFEAFDEAGKLKDDALSRRVEALAQRVGAHEPGQRRDHRIHQ